MFNQAGHDDSEEPDDRPLSSRALSTPPPPDQRGSLNPNRALARSNASAANLNSSNLTSSNPREFSRGQSAPKLRVPQTTNINNTTPIRKSMNLSASAPVVGDDGQPLRASSAFPNQREKETYKKIAQAVQPVDPSYLKDYGPVPAGYDISLLNNI